MVHTDRRSYSGGLEDTFIGRVRSSIMPEGTVKQETHRQTLLQGVLVMLGCVSSFIGLMIIWQMGTMNENMNTFGVSLLNVDKRLLTVEVILNENRLDRFTAKDGENLRADLMHMDENLEYRVTTLEKFHE